MSKEGETIDNNDPFDLGRFSNAQDKIYKNVLSELKDGHKQTHWMWFIFPQVDGLGYSATSILYAIKSVEEARQYLNHPLLGARLVECSQMLLAIKGRSVSDIFGYPDDLKLKSCMTLFAYVAGQQAIFARVLDKYFHGEQDVKTLQILEKLK